MTISFFLEAVSNQFFRKSETLFLISAVWRAVFVFPVVFSQISFDS